jgi:hypothetical protein
MTYRTLLGIVLAVLPVGAWACSANQDLGNNGIEDELQRNRQSDAGGGGAGAAADSGTATTSGGGSGPDGSSSPDGNSGSNAATFDPWRIDGTKPVLSHQELFDYLEPKNAPQGTSLGTFQIFARERVCPGQCNVWKESNPATLSGRNSFGEDFPVALPAGGAGGNIYVVPTPTPEAGFSFNLFLAAPLPSYPSESGAYVFISLSSGGVDDSGESVGDPPQLRTIGAQAFSPATLLWLNMGGGMLRFPEGTPELNLGVAGERSVLFDGRIYKDGTVHLVSALQQGGTGAGTHQLAIVGKLQGL